MTAYDPHASRGAFLRWLGFGSADEQDCEPCRTPAPDEDPRARRRRQVLSDVSSFLMAHGLEVSPFNLGVAHELISGANADLAETVGRRVALGEPVTDAWLADAARHSGSPQAVGTLHELMNRLEITIGEFARTTGAARRATSEYTSALEQQVDGLAHEGDADVAALIGQLALAMLSRTRMIEAELERSERETRKLQKRLQEARRDAEVDHLTGLPNRRAFEAVFAREVIVARDSGEPLCVAFCDVDHFKRINDVHGHQAGDRILRNVAKTLAELSDDTCHVARHGGEEFVAVLRGRTLDQACALLDSAREAMAARRLVNRTTDVPVGKVTFSAGVADVWQYARPRDALWAADRALYEAKKAGRNQVARATAP